MMEFPSGALALSSPLYIYRPPLEALCIQNIELPGSLTRIKGPRHIGKSSLLVKLMAHARELSYRTVLIDFQTAESTVYSDLSRFLRWFCNEVTRQLGLPSQLEDYWDDDTGAKLSTTIYFEEYLLEEVKTPIVLALNEVNCVFEHAEIAQDFLPLLRFWYEQAKHNSDLTNAGFHSLRTIVVHSTDIYVSLNVHQSPFNVGLPVHLRPFNEQQVQQLADRYQLAISAEEQQLLMALVGGHPYLLSVAFYNLANQSISLSQLLDSAATTAGIFTHHLQSLLSIIETQPALIAALRHVFRAAEPVEVKHTYAHQLSSLGLVVLEGNLCKPACMLYQQFFNQHKLIQASYEVNFQRLRDENKQLKRLANIDQLTQVANRRFFDERLQVEWQRAAAQKRAIALIMIDIDYFKLYNDTYGHLAGDRCLHKVAQALAKHIRHLSDVVARYGGEEFAVILTKTDVLSAAQSAHRLKEAVQALSVRHDASKLKDKLVTLSMGLACAVPQQNQTCAQLVAAADSALYTAKQEGRNQLSINSTPISHYAEEHSSIQISL